jgi:hypothetical protein
MMQKEIKGYRKDERTKRDKGTESNEGGKYSWKNPFSISTA